MMLSTLNVVFVARDGVRPYVEVWQGEHKMLSTQQDYDRMRLYMPQEHKVGVVITCSTYTRLQSSLCCPICISALIQITF